jgi:hypothetical protein
MSIESNFQYKYERNSIHSPENLPYLKLFNLVVPYLTNARWWDLTHTLESFDDMQKVISTERKTGILQNLNETEFKQTKIILSTSIILHDCGWRGIKSDKIQKKWDDPELRKLHMIKGGIIAEKILTQLQYSPQDITLIRNLVEHHDEKSYKPEDHNIQMLLEILQDVDELWVMKFPSFFNDHYLKGGKDSQETYLHNKAAKHIKNLKTNSARQLMDQTIKLREKQVDSHLYISEWVVSGLNFAAMEFNHRILNNQHST